MTRLSHIFMRLWRGRTPAPAQLKLSHPLLVKLRQKTPGTFRHSLRVANLMTGAAILLKLDPSLAWVAGLFHDVGKMKNGFYFIEALDGRRTGRSPVETPKHLFYIIDHPRHSAQILREWGFPGKIVDLVMHHHGSGPCKAKLGPNMSGSKGITYSGKRPQSKMAGLLMITDRFEAILNGRLDGRSDVSLKEIHDLTHEILARVWRSLIEEDQLKDSGLNLAHYQKIETAFERVLFELYRA